MLLHATQFMLLLQLHHQHHVFKARDRFGAVQHRIIDTNKTDTGLGRIDTLVLVLPITSNLTLMSGLVQGGSCVLPKQMETFLM